MKKTLLAMASALVSLVLPGCFQNETTIHLNKDGSGTLVEETKLGAQMLAMMEQMAALGGGNAKEDPIAKIFSEEKAKTRASELGEGVAFENPDDFKKLQKVDQKNPSAAMELLKDIKGVKFETPQSKVQQPRQPLWKPLWDSSPEDPAYFAEYQAGRSALLTV